MSIEAPTEVSPLHRTVLACEHVVDGGALIRQVRRDARGGAWRFLCGTSAHLGRELRLVPRKLVLGRDPAVALVGGLPRGFAVSRSSSESPWRAVPTESRA